jgi:hypothetical protein
MMTSSGISHQYYSEYIKVIPSMPFFGSVLAIDKLGFHTAAKVAEGSHQILIELHPSKHYR